MSATSVAVRRLAAVGWLAVGLFTATAAAAQSGPSVRLAGFAGGSLRDGIDGLSVMDVVTVSGRIGLPRASGVTPWLQGGRFTRPDLVCPEGVACNTEGWSVLGGASLPLTAEPDGPGLRPYLVGGVGVASADRTIVAYALGLGAAVRVVPRLAPLVEVRYEELPGIQRVVVVHVGLAVEPF